jgi:hypothetical protein
VVAVAKLKILGPVVGPITIDVMHLLIASRPSTEHLGHDVTMLKVSSLLRRAIWPFLVSNVDGHVAVPRHSSFLAGTPVCSGPA